MGIYAVVWISLEGSLARDLVLGVGITAVSLLHLLQKKWSHKTFSRPQYLQITTLLGLVGGLGSGPLTIAAMIFKTGLHAHGPEFTLAQLQWVSHQIPLWAIAGSLIGLSLGVLTYKPNQPRPNSPN